MWRFLPNVSSPDANKTSTKSTNKRDRDPWYDKTKRWRSYRKEWELQYKWLAYDEEEGVMFCKTCRDSNVTGERGGRGQNSLYKGSNTFKLETLKTHGASENHQLAVIWRALIQWSPRLRAAAALTDGTQPVYTYVWDTLRPITATAANQRLHMYEIRGGGQSPLRQRPQPTSVYICKNTSRPITATAAIQCLHMYERRRGRSLKPTSVYESRRGGSLITIKSRLRFWCRWM